MRSLVTVLMFAMSIACTSPRSQTGDGATTAGPGALSAAPTRPACAECPPSSRIDAVLHFVQAEFEAGGEVGDISVTVSIHTGEGWFDVAKMFSDATDAENLQPVPREFAHGDAVIKLVRAQPNNVGMVSIDDINYYQEHRTLSNFFWNAKEGTSDRVFMNATIRVLD